MSLDRWINRNPRKVPGKAPRIEHLQRFEELKAIEQYRQRIQRIFTGRLQKTPDTEAEQGLQAIDQKALALLGDETVGSQELKDFYDEYKKSQRKTQKRRRAKERIKVKRTERVQELNSTPEPNALQAADLREKATPQDMTGAITQLSAEIAGLSSLLRAQTSAMRIDPRQFVSHIPQTPEMPLLYFGPLVNGGHLMQYGATSYIVNNEGYFLSYDPVNETFLAYNTLWIPVFEAKDAQQEYLHFTYVSSLPEEAQRSFRSTYGGVETYAYDRATGVPFILGPEKQPVELDPGVYGAFSPQVTFS